MSKERFRIEVLDKKTKEKTIFLVDNFNQEVRFNMVPLHSKMGVPPQMVQAGYEFVTLNMFNPKMKIPLKRKKSKKNGKAKKTSKR